MTNHDLAVRFFLQFCRLVVRMTEVEGDRGTLLHARFNADPEESQFVRLRLTKRTAADGGNRYISDWLLFLRIGIIFQYRTVHRDGRQQLGFPRMELQKHRSGYAKGEYQRRRPDRQLLSERPTDHFRTFNIGFQTSTLSSKRAENQGATSFTERPIRFRFTSGSFIE